MIQQTASGWCVNPDDIGAIQRVLTEIHSLRGRYPHKSKLGSRSPLRAASSCR